jgi:large subunit ribosomal protein L21
MEEKNMYAVVATGGKQYKITEGETLRIEKVDGNVGDSFTFDQVLMVADGENLAVGEPMVAGASVSAHIVEQGKSKKILVFKYKRRKRYRRKQGHRQPFTAVKIDNIAHA